jgi:hypothetical protein
MPSPGDQLVQAVERVVAILDSRPQDVTGSIYVSPQQPLGDLTQPLWHYRRGQFVQLRQLLLMFARGGPLEQLALKNNWHSDFEASKLLFDSAFRSLNFIRYFNSEQRVEIGDHVRLRSFFRKADGRVNYVPGLSLPNDEIDFGGLFRIGVALRKGGFTHVHVDPDSLAAKEGLEFQARDSAPTPPVPSPEELNE